MSSTPDKPGWFAGWPSDIPARQIRILSVLAGIGLVVGCIVPLFDPQPWYDTVGGFGFLFATIVFAGRRGGRGPMPGELDERERAERAEAIWAGYMVTAVCLAIAYGWVLMSGVGQGWLPDKRQAGWLLGGLFWLHLMLPAAILAWREPKDENEE